MGYPWRLTNKKLDCRPFKEKGYPSNKRICNEDCPYHPICSLTDEDEISIQKFNAMCNDIFIAINSKEELQKEKMRQYQKQYRKK